MSSKIVNFPTNFFQFLLQNLFLQNFMIFDQPTFVELQGLKLPNFWVELKPAF